MGSGPGTGSGPRPVLWLKKLFDVETAELPVAEKISSMLSEVTPGANR
jgi:hypothetical protein